MESNQIYAKTSQVQDEIRQLQADICAAHNPELVDKTNKLSPNENTIYHIYSDGEVTEQKGSWAYRQRSERTYCAISRVLTEDGFGFTHNFVNCGPICNKLGLILATHTHSGYSYAIVTLEQALEFRKRITDIADKL